MFVYVCVCCLLEFVGGELGNKNETVKALSATFVVFLWVIYIALSSIKADIVRLDSLPWQPTSYHPDLLTCSPTLDPLPSRPTK